MGGGMGAVTGPAHGVHRRRGRAGRRHVRLVARTLGRAEIIMKFDSFGDLADHLRRVAAAMPRAEEHGLTKAAELIQEEAKAEIGHYQDATGPFDAWEELADATKADRRRKQFSENDPLLRTGDLQRSIAHEVEGRKAVVGSDSEVAAALEFGTSHIPPRSFLGGAAFRKGEEAANVIGEAIALTIAGRPPGGF